MRKRTWLFVTTFTMYIVLSAILTSSTKITTPLDNLSASGNDLEDLVLFDSDVPISIDSDAELTNLAAEKGWSGTGSFDDPYILKDLAIRSEDTCIRIQNTNLSFRLIDSSLESHGDANGVGIYFNNVSNAYVENITIVNQRYGLHMRNSQYCTFNRNTIGSISDTGITIHESSFCEVLNNSIQEAEIGIELIEAYGCRLDDNDVTETNDRGFALSSCRNCSLMSNIARSVEGIGFHIQYSENLSISLNIDFLSGLHGFVFENIENSQATNNTSVLNSGDGFNLERCTNLAFYANIAVQNELDGISMQINSGCSFRSNLLCNNGGYGIESHSGLALSEFESNSIGWNGEENAWESVSMNIWLGNKWSNYNGSGPYHIAGVANASDMTPFLLIDSLSPNIYGPPNLDDVQDNESFIIRWYAWDCQPFWYEIYLNSNMIEEGEWSQSSISTRLGPLDEGVHIIQLLLYDFNGNSEEDYVYVYVSSVYGNTESLAFLGIGISILLIALTLTMYRSLHLPPKISSHINPSEEDN